MEKSNNKFENKTLQNIVEPKNIFNKLFHKIRYVFRINI